MSTMQEYSQYTYGSMSHRAWHRVMMNEIQTFDWTGGHSGRLIDEKSAEKLESLWKDFTERNEDMFKIRAFRQEVDPSEFEI